MSTLEGCNGAALPDAISTIEWLDWPRLRREALYGFAGEIITAATEQSEADPAAILATFLTLVGIALGRKPWIKVSDDYHHPRLFCAIVGQSARGRKGTSEGPVRRIWEIAEQTLGPLAWRPGPMSTGEGLINAIRDGTGEDDPGVADKRLLMVESEFAAALRAMRREGNTLSATLRTAWDGKTLEPLTKSQPIKATGPHVGIVAHITEAELSTLLSHVEIFNGFANRFLWWCARRQRLVPLARGLSDTDAERLGKMLAAQLTAVQDIERVEFSAEARRVYETTYELLTADYGGLYGVITSRAEVQVIRVAMMYACLDGSSIIELPHLEAAFAVWEYCAASAKRLFGSLSINPLEGRLRQLLAAGPKSTTILHRLLGNHTDAAALRVALSNLEGQAGSR